jgi:tetratricopeptide (TPR) repeat protein
LGKKVSRALSSLSKTEVEHPLDGMADNSRIDDLRRRVQQDPASIAFAQLAEECRRSGLYAEAIETCRAGLTRHPGYLSARVTLGRALVELGRLDEAEVELSRVLESAPENLAAIRGLAEIYHRRGDLAAALTHCRRALLLARNDPDLEETIADLSRQVEPPTATPPDSLTLDHIKDELLKYTPPPPQQPPAAATELNIESPAVVVHEEPVDTAADERAMKIVVALERWLSAIHDVRERRLS